jgi:hypothetical protein
MIKRCVTLLLVGLMPLLVQNKGSSGNPLRLALVKMPYVGERNVPELSGGPGYLEQGGLQKLLEDQGFQTRLSSAKGVQQRGAD